MSPQATDLVAQFSAAKERAKELIHHLDEEAFLVRPHETAWSVGECLEHLNQTAGLYLAQIREVVAGAPKVAPNSTTHVGFGFLGGRILKFIEPPVRGRRRAPANVHPVDVPARAECLARFEAYQDEFQDMIREADGLDWRKIRVPSPVASWLHMNLAAAFAFVVAHERRHLWQIEQQLARRGVPTG